MLFAPWRFGEGTKKAPLVFFFWDDLILLNYNVYCSPLSWEFLMQLPTSVMGLNRSFAVFFREPTKIIIFVVVFWRCTRVVRHPRCGGIWFGGIDTKEELIITSQLPNNQWSTSHETIKRNQQVNGGTLWDRNNSFWKMASDSQVWYFTKGPRETVFSFVAEV